MNFIIINHNIEKDNGQEPLFFAVGSVNAEVLAKYGIAVSDLIVSDLVPAKQAELVKNSSLIADIENAIRNGRKFELLTRRSAALEAIRKEQEFASSEYAAGDAAATGNISNAQSLVQVEVLQFNFGRSSSKVPNIQNKFKVNDYCSIELSVQIIDTERGAVVASFPIKASSTIVSVSNQDIWINRGNDSGMKLGEVFEVFEPGEELIDPATGENLGSTETLIGKVKVVRINPKASVVHMVNGNATSVSTGYILRRPVKSSK